MSRPTPLKNVQRLQRPGMQRHANGLTTLRVQGNPRKGYQAWALTVPAIVCRLLPNELHGALFTCELIEEGILFRPMLDMELNEEPSVSWINQLKKRARANGD